MAQGAGGAGSALGGAFAVHCRGDVRLFSNDIDCTPKSKKARALLAVLAAEQRPLTRVKIIDLLWSDRQEEQARASLRTLLADLKEQFNHELDALLVVDRERVALAPNVRTDLADPPPTGSSGELFEGLDHIDPELDEWLRLERERRLRIEPAAEIAVAPQSPSKQPWRRSFAIMGLLALLGTLAAAIWFNSRAQGRLYETIAVLPLTGATDASGRLLGDDLMQRVRDDLVTARDARVLGADSSQRLAAAGYSSAVLKQLYGVDLIVSGNIRAGPNGYQVSARLIQAATDAELWSVRYLVKRGEEAQWRDRATRDLAERVRESLSLGPSDRTIARWYSGPAGQRLTEARRLILVNRPPEALEARRILLELVAAHPDNVPALAALGEATMAASDHPYVGGTLPAAEAREEARAYANRAIRLAPQVADGYAALGASYMETAQAIAPLERAVALEPGNYLHHTRLGRALEFEDRYQEAYNQQLDAVRLEPLAALPMINLVRAADQLNRDPDIRASIAAYASRRPSLADLGYVRAYYAFLRDDNVGCIRNFRSVPLPNVSPPQRNVLLFCITALGENSAALGLVADEDSLRRDILTGDATLVEGRVRKLGRDFWRRHYESLAAAEFLISSGRGDFLLSQFDQAYNDIDDFVREGAFLTLYPQPIIVLLLRAGRQQEALRLRQLLLHTLQSAEHRPGGDEWENYNGASVAMIDGNRDRAASLLARCAPTCIFSVLRRDISDTAMFRPLIGNPRFNKVIRDYRLMINRQRQSLGLPALPLT